MDDDPSDTERLVTLTRTLVDQVDKIRLYVGIICAVQVLAFLGVVYAVTRT